MCLPVRAYVLKNKRLTGAAIRDESTGVLAGLACAPACLFFGRGYAAAPGSADLQQAIGILRDMNTAGKRTLPDKVPTSFVRPCWQPYVTPDELPVDRRYYELCVLSELRDRLRAGEVWVAGSRQYRNFETHLIPAATFQSMRREPDITGGTGKFRGIRGVVRAETIADYKSYNQNRTEFEYWFEK